MSKALGLLEVYGFTTAIVIGDMIAKSGDVRIVALDKNKPASGDAARVPLLMTIKFEGDVADVEQALMVGVEEAKRRDLLVTYDLISRQAEDTKKMARIDASGKDKLRG